MRHLLVLVTALLVLSTSVASASPDPYAPVNRPGPRLSVPIAQLEATVKCTPSAYGSHREVALFVPGTGVEPDEAFSWNWFRALDAIGHPYCSVALPASSVGDVQVSAEYVVHAIRHTRAISRGKIAVIGHSQGGVSSRFALRFWPDTRAMVADHVGLAAVNHGSDQNDALYPDGNGPAFALQLKRSAKFVEAVNSRQETFPGIAYTSLSTVNDQFVTPKGTTDLRGATHISLQDVCPENKSDHITIGTSDNLAFALTMNAITRRGPATPADLPASVCAQDLMPGADPATVTADLTAFLETAMNRIATAPVSAAEPALKPYVFARG
ncbi:triacylglycerol lipase [Lentzea sp. HUAS12]|uniref:esterase/lipase family protein n=1 Tax=Lentzea sp. HUAS12 TaxID=2951806 RepID=UPI0020A0674B|nr:lipase [Lentzea sp. HUAS12]USX52792.1 lipase [Lentzea sp. HUAS12]